ERNQDAEALERLHRLLGPGDVFDQDAFGDFELQAARREPAVTQRLADLCIEVFPAKLRGRDVDRNPEGLVPRCGLTAGLHQHPVVDLCNRATPFCDRDELSGRDDPAIWMPPTDEGLIAGDATIAVLLRLIVQIEFAPL